MMKHLYCDVLRTFYFKDVYKWFLEKVSEAKHEKGLDVSLNENENILYRGASIGSTISFISKYTKIIFSVEKSPKMMIPIIKNP